MRILFAASEVAPLAKTGGLADVAGALPRALARLGEEVRVVMPAYRVAMDPRHHLRDAGLALSVPIGGRSETAAVLEGRLGAGPGGDSGGEAGGVPVFLIRADRYYDRDGLYGVAGQDYQDNAERFAFFSRAVVELARQGPFKPDLFHLHDWQTGLVAAYLKHLYAGDPALGQPASVFTIHNLGYQGLFWHYDMHLTGLGWELFTPEGLEFWGKLSYLKAGLVFADMLTTVSPTYAREIQTPELGHGMDGVLRARADRLVGILNGIDTEEWNPATDRYIARRYNARTLAGKGVCKADLQRTFGLPVEPKTPLLGVVTRLAEQKGVDLLDAVLPALVERGVQFVLLGSGDPAYEARFRASAARWPRQVGVRIAYDNVLAHKIEAGADMFLMPSRYEPCGLNQMMSLRYGTVPIVRATGGLADTVMEASPEAGGNGFVFVEYDPAAFLAAIDRALAAYRKPRTWRALMRRGMAGDYSWDAAARRYLEVYRQARRLAAGREAVEV
ncbi:MAG TPA: glycogen synthase GlgA [Thermodesulfobacteriota bacterium]|nr:glycogen synthase GlgA [Thermodesulfobacteriota bacterium]